MFLNYYSISGCELQTCNKENKTQEGCANVMLYADFLVCADQTMCTAHRLKLHLMDCVQNCTQVYPSTVL